MGSYFAASTWKNTKTLFFMQRTQARPTLGLATYTRAIIVEIVSWVTEDSLGDHEWITETEVTMKKISFWGQFTATSTYHALFNGHCHGFQHRKTAKFRDTVNSAIELTCNIALYGTHTPRAGLPAVRGSVGRARMISEVINLAMSHGSIPD